MMMFYDARQMASRYFDDSRQTLYFTPAHYLAVFTNYRKLFVERQKSI